MWIDSLCGKVYLRKSHSLQTQIELNFWHELQWLEYLWNHEILFETGVVRANEWTGGIVGIYFRYSFK